MLTIYRRHARTCPHRSRNYRRCKCPIWLQGTLSGRKIRKSLDLTSWEASLTLVREMEVTGRLDIGVLAPSIGEAVQKFLSDAQARNLRPATLRLFDVLLRSLIGWCENAGYRRLDDLSVDAVREFRNGWKFSAITALKKLERLRTFFRFCVDSGWLEKNPAKPVASPRVQQPPTLPFSDDEVSRIIAACDEFVPKGIYGLGTRTRTRAFVYLLRYTGLRISDVASLTVSKVRDGKVFLHTQKTGTPVWIPIPRFVEEELAGIRRSGEFYFQTGGADPKTVRGSWDRTLRKLFALAKIEDGHAHRFRDTFAVSLLLAGTPIEDVAILLRHSSMKTTERSYAPWVKARQEKLEERVRLTWTDQKPKLTVVRGNAG